MILRKNATKSSSDEHGCDETREHKESCERCIHCRIFGCLPLHREINLRWCNLQMMRGLWFVAVGNETAEVEKRGTGGENVKVEDNTEHEEQKHRFSKRSHGEAATV